MSSSRPPLARRLVLSGCFLALAGALISMAGLPSADALSSSPSQLSAEGSSAGLGLALPWDLGVGLAQQAGVEHGTPLPTTADAARSASRRFASCKPTGPWGARLTSSSSAQNRRLALDMELEPRVDVDGALSWELELPAGVSVISGASSGVLELGAQQRWRQSVLLELAPDSVGGTLSFGVRELGERGLVSAAELSWGRAPVVAPIRTIRMHDGGRLTDATLMTQHVGAR